MTFIRRFAVGTAVAGAMIGLAGTASASGAQPEPPPGGPVQVLYSTAGPFDTVAECNRVRREYDIYYTVSSCYVWTGQKLYFNYW